ncbi:MAG: YiiX/YebB-like N1pC/P60 family cysteine hydrolase [Candidatus Melainabacteria bacterium]|nr:YiiX/YebB-like N1pC/P60 family cysteine hydrolase [Candidatus Melainabacteria bacterium]
MVERGMTLKSENYAFGANALATDSRAEDDGQSDSASPWNFLSIVGELPRMKSSDKTGTTTGEAPAKIEAPATVKPDAPVKPATEIERPRRHRESTAAADLKKELPAEKNLRDGDIIFCSNGSFDEGKAIQLVSKSPLTHCGVLFKEGDDWVVYEAVQPVKKTPLKDFHKTDNGETYAVRRLKNADEVLTKDNLDKLQSSLKKNVDKDYDHLFGWGNDKMYCSELVWKAYYESTKLKVGKIQMVGDFDLKDPLVSKLVEARYGKNVPVTEPTVTPGAVFDSRLLKTVR